MAGQSTKITVDLGPRGKADLDQACKLTGLNKTDAVIRALRVLRMIAEQDEDEIGRGAELVFRNKRTGHIEVIKLV